MLQPKRTKFRKQHKGRNRGLAHRGSSVSFGTYGLKSTGRGRMTARQIEAARRAMTRLRRSGLVGYASGLGALGIVGLFAATIGAQIVTGAPLFAIAGSTGLFGAVGVFLGATAALLVGLYAVFGLAMRQQ